MSSIHLPPVGNKHWTQPNMGDLLGVLWATFNCDLNLTDGKISPSARVYMVANGDDTAAVSTPMGFVRTAADTTDRWWGLVHGKLMKTTNTSPLVGWAADALANSPTDVDRSYSDIVEHEGNLVVSSNNDLHRLVAGVWTKNWWTGAGNLNQTALTTSWAHPLDVFNRLLLIGDGNFLHQVDRNAVVAYKRISLPTQYIIRAIRHSVDRTWIATQHIYNGKCAIFEWDGFSETWNKYHELEGDICFSAVVKQGVPYAITNQGILFKYNGYTFIPAPMTNGLSAQLPIATEDVFQVDSAQRTPVIWKDTSTYQISVHWNGMAVIENKIHILLNGLVGGSNQPWILDNMRSGIWCYEETVGLYHRYSLSDTKTGKDYGSTNMTWAGALVPTGQPDKGLFLAGGQINRSVAGSTVDGIFAKDTNETYLKRGYFITTAIPTQNVEELWDKVWLKFSKLRVATDDIKVKWLSSDGVNILFPFMSSVTWTSNTTFTSTNASFANCIGGEEIEVMFGQGAGTTVHISTISVNAGTYTITVDETPFTGLTSTGFVRVSKFKLAGGVADLTIVKKDFPMGNTAPWVKIKVEMRGSQAGPEIEELIAASTPNVAADS